MFCSILMSHIKCHIKTQLHTLKQMSANHICFFYRTRNLDLYVLQHKAKAPKGDFFFMLSFMLLPIPIKVIEGLTHLSLLQSQLVSHIHKKGPHMSLLACPFQLLVISEVTT